jgi:hypothetical protein
MHFKTTKTYFCMFINCLRSIPVYQLYDAMHPCHSPVYYFIPETLPVCIQLVYWLRIRRVHRQRQGLPSSVSELSELFDNNKPSSSITAASASSSTNGGNNNNNSNNHKNNSDSITSPTGATIDTNIVIHQPHHGATPNTTII